MNDLYPQVAALLMDLECEMRRLDIWSDQSPSVEAFASEEPFCIDTMDFSDWLQFVFLPRMRQMVEMQADLPKACGIAPIAEEYLVGRGALARSLVAVLLSLDELLSQN